MSSNGIKPSTPKKKRTPKARHIGILLVAIFGVIFLSYSRAATPALSVEPEDGNQVGGVIPITGSTMSGDGGIQFGSQSPGLVIVSPQSELNQVKQAVTTGNKKAYWEYIKGRPYTRVDTGNLWVASKTTTYGGKTYTFNMSKFRSIDHPDSTSVNAQGNIMLVASQNAYGCALEWNIGGGDQACGDQAVNILDSWAQGLNEVYCRPSGIDGRENQIKLYSEWSVPNFAKAAELVWNHPSFTQEKKTRVANWMWTAFLLQNSQLKETSGEVLGHSGAGWNGRVSSLQSRLDAGLVMKAAGHAEGENVINDIKNKLDSVLPSILYYGKAPWHSSLDQPWPTQPPGVAGATTTAGIASYWQFTTGSAIPPQFFIGQTQETGRDVGHTQMGMASLTEVLRSLRLNGYADRFAPNDLGNILLEMGEQHAKVYNEALDKYWAGGYATLDNLSCNWQPSEWNNRQLSAKTDCPAGAGAVSFKMGGNSSDHGWEYLRTELKNRNYPTPELDRLVFRLRGTGTRSTNNVAGYGVVDFGNQLSWEPLFAPDYQ